jgi:hypothetical protein
MMATKTIEAALVISGADKTGNLFEKITGKIRGLEQAGKSLGSATRSLGNIPAQFGAIDKAFHKLAGGIAATMAVHKMTAAVHQVIQVYKEFDDIVRYQRAITGMSATEQAPFIKQAIRLGGTTPFNDIKVLHAQLDLVQRGVNKEFIMPITEMAADYAQAMGAELPEAAKTIEGILFSTRKHIEDGNEALKVAKHTVDYAVKLAKIGGLDNEDIKAFFKFAGMAGSTAGLSDESMGALAALMRRANIPGAEAGTAVRAIAGKLVSPTKPGIAALLAMGIDYNKFVTMPNAFSTERLGLVIKDKFGKNIPASVRGKLAGILSNADIIGDRQAFITAASGALAPMFGGHLHAQDAAKLAAALGSFWKLSASGVNAEGLLAAIVSSGHLTLATANALFGEKQGARALAGMRDPKLFAEFRQKLLEAPEDFAHKIAIERMAGFSGALQRTEGSLMNLWTALGRANDPFLTAGFDKLAHTIQHIAELDEPTLRYGTYLVTATTSLIAFNAALKAWQALNTLASGGASVAGVTAAGAAVRGIGWLPWFAAAASIATTPDILGRAPGGRSWDDVYRRRGILPEVEDWRPRDLNIKVDVRTEDGLFARVKAFFSGAGRGSRTGTTGDVGQGLPDVQIEKLGDVW